LLLSTVENAAPVEGGAVLLRSNEAVVLKAWWHKTEKG
jgi:hypothetical protein